MNKTVIVICSMNMASLTKKFFRGMTFSSLVLEYLKLFLNNRFLFIFFQPPEIYFIWVLTGRKNKVSPSWKNKIKKFHRKNWLSVTKHWKKFPKNAKMVVSTSFPEKLMLRLVMWRSQSMKEFLNFFLEFFSDFF